MALAKKLNINQGRARYILESALAEHRLHTGESYELPPDLARRICQHFAPHLADVETFPSGWSEV